MTAQTQEIDRHQIALDIEADPAGTYDRIARSEWGTGLDRWLPRHMHAGMVRYVLLGIRPGSFMQAIIVGDYFEACRRADDPNRAGLFGYAMFLHNYAPGGCFGSREHLTEWIKDGGILGHPNQEAEQC